nr:hypothetical protein [Myxococcota bacterium]
MRRTTMIAVGCALAGGALMMTSGASAQQALGGGTTSISYDFTGFLASGFGPTPAAGELDSDEWIATGFSDPALTFGGTAADGSDYARGTSEGGTSTAGVYAYDVASSPASTDVALGAQASAAEFTPGAFQLRITNATGRTLRAINLAYALSYLNNTARSTRHTVSVVRESDLASVTVDALQSDTPEGTIGAAVWIGVPRAATIDLDPIGIPAGANFIIVFAFDDLAGSGERDEIAIDDVVVSIPTCGNATVDTAESCDDGDVVTETTCPYGMATCTTCNSTCTMELMLTGSVCGDTMVDAAEGEACDDGNTVAETECAYGTATCTGCSADCTAALTLMGGLCGDGTLQATEETCDDGNAITETECAYGTPTCTACTADCSTDLSLTGAACGDGTVDSADGEACDDSNTVTETSCAYGTASCAGCSGDCTGALTLMGPVCGDGTIDTAFGETCDDGNTTAGDGCDDVCMLEPGTDGGMTMTDGGMVIDDAGMVMTDGGVDDGGVENDAGAEDGDASTADGGARSDAGGADAGGTTPPA